MKKYIIIGLVVLVGAALLILPILSPNSSKSEEMDTPATFAFKDNLATEWDKIVPINIDIHLDDVVKLELIYNDSVFQTWQNPTGKIRFQLKAGFFGLGTRVLQLQSTLSNGATYSDNRMVRVLSDIVPELWIAKILQSYPHQTSSFTQGLEFNGGQLFESTGQRGQSFVAQVDLMSGAHTKKIGLDANYFGEGITIFGDKLYQLTWQEQKCFVYDKNSLVLEKDISYIGEGWGLCNDGKSIIMSNGTERLQFRNPKTFEIERTIEVYSHVGPVTSLNELEYADDLIYANVWMTNKIVVIDPRNGKVLSEIDASELVIRGKGTGDVLNGIAYDSRKNKWYMTGKNWPKLFEVTWQKPSV